jgi:peptidoglycan/xylan/chitin deacetylase (PgdA/CDA1 family)
MTPRVSWPSGHQSALCLSVDIDGHTMWTSVDADNHRRPTILSQSDYEFNVGVELVLDLLRNHQVTTTFFIPGGIAGEHASTVKAIQDEGHEIACHGWLHESVFGFTRDQEFDLLSRSTEALTEVAGGAPVGYRAGLAEVNPHTWDILRELGYIYSSNLSSSLWPFLHEGPGPDLVEIPIHLLLDDGPYYLLRFSPPNFRQPFPPSDVLEIWTTEFSGIHELGGVTTLVLHPALIGRPSRLRMLGEFIATARATPGVWITTEREVAEHYLRQGGN